MDSIFSDRITDVPRSFIREILKVAVNPEVISFAGGLPNRDLFPVQAIQAATNRVFESYGKEALQYSASEGYQGLREYISRRYREKNNLEIPPDNILITNGSQQGLDLLGKIFLNEGDNVVIEEPGYLGAIQTFSVFRATFHTVPLSEKGLDIDRFREALKKKPKLIYTVPNFQNPTGITYPEENRLEIAKALSGTTSLLIEDDPYGYLRFSGKSMSSFWKLAPKNSVLLGSFSKIIAPGLRIGWVAASDEIMEKLIVAKQAADLQSNNLAQRIIYQYLSDNDVDEHIATIRHAYNTQKQAMSRCLQTYLPPTVARTNPEGGMFLWLTLPQGISSMSLFSLAIKDKVAFVPGNPFYVDGREAETLRLNFSCTDEATTEVGIKRLGKAVAELLNSH